MICEGEIYALSAIMARPAGVGLPGWSHWKDVWTLDLKGKEIILILDDDEAESLRVSNLVWARRRF